MHGKCFSSSASNSLVEDDLRLLEYDACLHQHLRENITFQSLYIQRVAVLCFERRWCSVVCTVPTLRTGRYGVQIPTVKVKVKFTLEQATKAQKERVGVQPYSFFNLGARRGWVVNATPGRFPPRERPHTRCIGGRVGPGAGLDRCGESPLHRDSIPRPFGP